MRKYDTKPPWLTGVYIYRDVKPTLDTLSSVLKHPRSIIISVLLIEALRNIDVLSEFFQALSDGKRVGLRFFIVNEE